MKKRLLSALFVVCLLVSAFAALYLPASADSSGKCGDNLNYSFKSASGKLTISGTGDMYDYSADKWAPWRFFSNLVTSVSFESKITSIGDYAFYQCGSITDFVIPNTVKTIGDFAFAYCGSLSSVTIQDGVEYIGSAAFYECSSLKQIVIPGSVNYLSSDVFNQCTALKIAKLMEGVKLIDCRAFKDCASLTTVFLPHTLKHIDFYVFENDFNIRDVFYNGTEREWNIYVRIQNHNDPLLSANIRFTPDSSIDEYAIDLSTGECVIPTTDYLAYLAFTLAAAENDGKIIEGKDSDFNPIYDVQNDGSYDIKLVVEYTGSEPKTRITLLDTNSFSGKDYDYDMSEEAEKWLLDQSNTLYTRKIRFIVPKSPFNDVPAGKWYTNAVLWCYSKGYMTGTSATMFEPNASFTRAMFVTVLAKIDNANTNSYTGSSFNDVPQGKWYSKPIQWAYKNGYASGLGGGKFGPNNPVTREQLAQFLYNYSQKKGYSTTGSVSLDGFPDGNKVSNYAKNAAAWAVGNGLISGIKVGNTVYLQPKGTATRAQVAVIVKNYVDLIG